MMQLALKAAVLYEITHNDGHRAVQGHSRSPILVNNTDRKPVCNFLLVNTNLRSMSYRFRVIAAAYLTGVPLFNSLV